MRSRIHGVAVAAFAWAVAAGAAPGYQNLESALRTNGSETLGAFEDVRAVLQRSSAVVLHGRDQLAYGVVVSADGFLLTKASEIQGISNLSVRVGREVFETAEVLAVDPAWDVALLKVSASDLVPVKWAATSDLPQGSWVVANGATSRSRRRAMIGIISANDREIEGGPSVVLGVSLDPEGDGLRITAVTEKSGAEDAGLKPGDLLLSLDDTELEGREQLLELLKTHRSGDRVRLSFERDGKRCDGEIELRSRDEFVPAQLTRNEQMSGRISDRRTGFKRVLQHDIPGNAESVGGPLLNLDGECVGMNIARANRVESFAIPVEELREILQQLRSRAEQ